MIDIGKLCFCSLLAALLAMASPDNSAAESLNEALVATYMNNPELQASRAGQRATDETVAQAVSGYRPTLVLQGSIGANQQESSFTTSGSGAIFGSGVQTFEPRRAGATLTQPVFSGGTTYFGVRRARNQVYAGREMLRVTEQTVLLDTVTAYMDVVRDEAVVNLNRNQVQVLQRQLEATQDRFRVGEITRTDVAQAEARLSGAQSALIEAEAQLTRGRAAYLASVGHLPDGVEPPSTLPALPLNEDQALSVALLESPQLLQARRTENASEHAINEMRGSLLPSIQIQGAANTGANTSTNTQSFDALSIAVQAQVPLYQSGSVWSRVRQARQTNSQDRLRIAEAHRGVVENVTNSWEGLRSARARIQSGEDQVRANEIALEGVRQESNVGTRTTLDVLDAEQELIDARVGLVRSQRDEYVAAYALLASIGRLSAQYLGLGVEFYDPENNYDDVANKWFGFDLGPDSYVDATGLDGIE